MKYASNIYEVTNWFLHTKPMKHKKLQKLLYFSYGIYLAQNNDEYSLNDQLFENNFEAWVHGPVDPMIYSLYKYCGINKLYIEESTTISSNQKILKALNKTMELYGNKEADVLEDITHKQLPWLKARNGIGMTEVSNAKLSEIDIFKTFKDILNYN